MEQVRDTETTCHCGASYEGSDHCPECACEQYESGDCGHRKLVAAVIPKAGATVWVQPDGGEPWEAVVQSYLPDGDVRVRSARYPMGSGQNVKSERIRVHG